MSVEQNRDNPRLGGRYDSPFLRLDFTLDGYGLRASLLGDEFTGVWIKCALKTKYIIYIIKI